MVTRTDRPIGMTPKLEPAIIGKSDIKPILLPRPAFEQTRGARDVYQRLPNQRTRTRLCIEVGDVALQMFASHSHIIQRRRPQRETMTDAIAWKARTSWYLFGPSQLVGEGEEG